MNKLVLKYFKAFKDEISIDFQDKNLLLYGENGAGKSSIYEGLKISFFKPRLEQTIPLALTQEEQNQYTIDFWGKYNNKKINNDFEIEINETSYITFSTENYQAFMISLDETYIDDRLNLNTLLEKFYFEIDNIDSFCTENYQLIELEANEALEDFQENIKVEIDIEDNFAIKIIDPSRNLERKDEIKKYFNEAKLNLILLLILFNAIRCAKDLTKKRLIVLDDFITSLDVSNRTFLIRYLLDNFSESQILIFTHNINFYNLTMYLVNTTYDVKSSWNFANIYEINGNNRLYIKANITKAADIKSEFSEDLNQEQLEAIGNKIRQKFEILLYEFSKLLMIGAVEESNKILERIENNNNLYLLEKKDASDLVDELFRLINDQNQNNIQLRLNSKINSYRQDEFENFKQILITLKLYRKVTMHPMSHGAIGQNPFTTREIKMSIGLLERFEAFISRFVDKDISRI